MNSDSDSSVNDEYYTDYDSESTDNISNEEYNKMLDNPILLPIHYWEKITKVMYFKSGLELFILLRIVPA